MRRTSWFVPSVLAGWLLASCAPAAPAPAAPQQPIKIGVMYPLTGDYASIGSYGMAGANIALQFFNAKGGINGRKVEFVQADVTSPDAAQSTAQRLITQDKVKILMGTTISGFSIPASAVAEREGALYWENSAASNEITGRGFKHVFKLSPHSSVVAVSAVDSVASSIAAKLGKAANTLSVANIYTDDAFGAAVGAATKQAAEAKGMKVALDESFNAGATDLSPLLLKMKGLNPDVLFVAASPASAILMSKQARQLAFSPAVIMTTLGFDSPQVKDGLANCVNGIMMSGYPNHGRISTQGLTDSAQKLVADYAAEYKKEFPDKPPQNEADLGFIGATVLLENVLKPVGSDQNVDALATAAKQVDIPAGGMINGSGVRFDDTGYNTRAIAVISQWQAGQGALVWPDNLAQAPLQLVPRPSWEDVCK